MSLSYFKKVIVYYFLVLLMRKVSGAGIPIDPKWKNFVSATANLQHWWKECGPDEKLSPAENSRA